MNAMDRFINEAEENFSNYEGEYIGDELYVGDFMDDEYFDGANSLGDLDSADRTITVNITNTDTANQLNATIFGAYENVTQPTGITVTVPESSHAQVREELKANPFFIKGFKYLVTNVAQLSNTITIRTSTSAGSVTEKPLQPNSYRSAQNQIATQIDAPSYQLKVDGRTSLVVPVNASEQVTFIFSFKTRANIGRLLEGRAVLDLARREAPVGLPQVDLKLKRAK